MTPSERTALRGQHSAPWCQWCDSAWPCVPARLLDALEAAEQQLAYLHRHGYRLRDEWEAALMAAEARAEAAEAEIAMLRQELGTLNAAEREIADLREAALTRDDWRAVGAVIHDESRHVHGPECEHWLFGGSMQFADSSGGWYIPPCKPTRWR